MKWSVSRKIPFYLPIGKIFKANSVPTILEGRSYYASRIFRLLDTSPFLCILFITPSNVPIYAHIVPYDLIKT